MVKAFVFGKFMPFHKGHEAMINFALTKCDFLTVLVCCSDKENIPSETRKYWIEETFKSIQKIEITIFNYKEVELPNTSESSQEVSNSWSKIFKELCPDYDLVITSEEYGNYVASFMEIKHIPFDIPKQLYPVSATAVRNDLFANWKFLPQSVKPYFVIKIVILGTESTGKTILSEKLVKHYNCSEVKEAGRDLIANSNLFEFDDLHLVASEHAKRINQKIYGESPLIIIDTGIHTTISYAKFIFNKELKADYEIYKTNKADLYLYLNNDVEYEQDGTRLSESDRNLLDKSNRNILKEKNIKFVEIKGDWEQRLEKALKEIDQIIKKKKRRE
jgi:HTH-type transcriptional regulator, transcriptional repressor of NAD biosynthesis genes